VPAQALPSANPPPTSPEKPASVAQALKPTAAKAFKVTFALSEPNAKHVSLCGEFNGWASDATPMKRDDGGNWETTVALPPGRYEYKFIVDGQWIPDPQARESVWNYHGTLNSVVQVWA
jgi:1,4-alpha-glucan branching enzyme